MYLTHSALTSIPVRHGREAIQHGRMDAVWAVKPAPPKSTYIVDRFGERLRTLRKEKNLTQLDMAVAFGIDRSFISDVERGKKAISLPLLEVIALGFGMTLSEMLADV